MTKLRLLNIFILITFSCCSENVTGPTTGSGDPMGCPSVEEKVLFSIDSFGVRASGESFVSDILTYTDTSNAETVFIEFIGSTNTDSTTYHPILEIHADQDSVLTETTQLEINRAHYMQTNLAVHTSISFSLILRCEKPVCDSAYLFINYLKIYTYK